MGCRDRWWFLLIYCWKQVTVAVVQLLGLVWLLAALGIAACQAPLSSTISWDLLKLMSIESVMLYNHLILCHPLLLLPSILPSIRVFSNESALHIRWPKYWSFRFRSVLPMNIQDWFPLGLIGLISLQPKGLLRVFFNTKFKSIDYLVFSLLYGPTLTFIHDHWKNHSFDYMILCQQSNFCPSRKVYQILNISVRIICPRRRRLQKGVD